MGLFEQLLQTPAAPDDDADRLTLDVSGASDAQVLGTLAQVFGEDDARRAICLHRDGQKLGDVRREAAIDLVADGMKGIGAADALLLPGVADYTISSWACPEPGCRYALMTIVLGDAPTCVHHRGRAMVMTA